MIKLGQILEQSKVMLKECNIPSYSLDAFLLLNKALNLSREYIICNPDYIVSEDDFLNYNKLLQRRVKREPISHILGVREFWGRDFKVTSDTLDPRPDSESLIEADL
jgi:release factor glutamine methyltransferase